MKWLTNIKPVLLLTLLALVSIAGLSRIEYTTRERVAENELAYKSEKLRELLAQTRYDNEPWTSAINMTDAAGQPITIYPVLTANKLVALIIETKNTQGYVATITLLTAVQLNADAMPTIIGVQVAAHRETPGLGDKIEVGRSNWLTQFAGRSLNEPAPERWTTRKDGGEFDQLTGATVTSRAVIKGISKSLAALAHNQQALQRQLTNDPSE